MIPTCGCGWALLQGRVGELGAWYQLLMFIHQHLHDQFSIIIRHTPETNQTVQ